jgi:hypothetical protein
VGCAALAGAATLFGAGCAVSETLNPPPDGGGSGGSPTNTGSGGITSPGGSGGATGSGGNISPGTGGRVTGSGGARVDAGNDTSAVVDAPVDSGGVLTYATDIAYELFFSCGGCHLPPTVQGSFDMRIVKSDDIGPNAYPTIMATVNGEHSGCVSLDATKKRVVPGKPDNSLLFIKISVPSPPSGCGGHMPNGTSITPGQIAKIKLWIQQGAKP